MFKTVSVMFVGCLASLVALSLIAPNAFARGENIKFGHVAPPFIGQAIGVDAFAQYVKEKTDGKIDIATFPSGQLGGERSLAEQVQAGTLQLATVSTAVLQNFVPQAAMIDMPFIFPDRKTAYATLSDPEVKERLFSYFPKKGMIAIGYTENEFRDFTNNKRPVHTPEDMKGLKVRVMNSPVFIDAFKQVGASPVGIPFPEIYNALETGVIDAQENPLLTSVMMKFTEVTKYVTKTHHSLTECIIITSVDYWESLSAKEKEIFQQAADVCIDTNRKTTVHLHEKLPGTDTSITSYAKQNDVEIVELSASERESFRKAMRPVWEKYRKKIGEDFFDFILSKIASHQG